MVTKAQIGIAEAILVVGLIAAAIGLSGTTEYTVEVHDTNGYIDIDEMDGGFANSEYLVEQNLDGGFANSTYYSGQDIDGGTA